MHSCPLTIGGHVIPLRYVFFIYVVALRMLKKSSSTGLTLGASVALMVRLEVAEESEDEDEGKDG